MGNCLRGNSDDIEVSDNSFHHRSSSRSNQPTHQQQQSHRHRSRHQHRHDNQQQQPCTHPPGNAGSTGHHAGSTAAASALPTAAGKNQPLRRERIRWTSDQPLTPSQLRGKREEFWDTAPAFDGRREIWDALRAAACAMETGDHELAQAIISGAGITLPRGLLTDSYDELGTRYQLPLYVLSEPTNLAESPPPTVDDGSVGGGSGGAGVGGLDGETDASSGAVGAGCHSNGATANPDSSVGQNEDLDDASAPVAPVTLKLRLSTSGRDLRLQASAEDTVARAKRRLERHLAAAGGGGIGTQRWFCYGRQLTDRMRIKDCPIPRGFVIQVILWDHSQQQQQQQATGDNDGGEN